jgi:hypothetical protein
MAVAISLPMHVPIGVSLRLNRCTVTRICRSAYGQLDGTRAMKTGTAAHATKHLICVIVFDYNFTSA